MSSLPKGWIGCPPMAESIIAGKFLVFKTPLSKNFNNVLKKDERFLPETIIENIKTKQKRIGLWIDFTNTNRYYPEIIIYNEGIHYYKIKCPGHGTVPTDNEIHQFMSITSRYIENQPLEDDSYIAVHCTHGLNRTGYFICTFLTLYCKYSIQAAIALFAKCRPPGIYRQIYLDHLLHLYTTNGDKPYPRIIVHDPNWLIYPDKNNIIPIINKSKEQQQQQQQQQEQVSTITIIQNIPKFIFTSNPRYFKPNDPCIRLLENNERNLILYEIYKLIQPNDNDITVVHNLDINNKLLPPPQLFSQTQNLSAENINYFNTQEYLVSWYTTSSVRYLLYIKSSKCIYFIDLFNTVFMIHNCNLHFPHSLNYNEHLSNTLLDGNMKWTPTSDTNNSNSFIPLFEIDDILVLDNVNVSHLSFIARRGLIQTQIIQPRNDALTNHFFDTRSEYCLTLQLSCWFSLEIIFDLLRDEMRMDNQSNTFKNVGILFKPLRMPYTSGPTSHFLKWSRSETIDFEIKILELNMCGLLVRESSTPFSTIELTGEELIDGQIVQGKYDFENSRWILFNPKSDYALPFSLQYAQDAMTTPTNITRDFLMDYIWKIRSNNHRNLSKHMHHNNLNRNSLRSRPY